MDGWRRSHRSSGGRRRSADILRVGDGLSHVEATWEIPVGAQFNARLASFSRLVRFDKRGTGLSDPVPFHEILDLEFGDVGPGAVCWAEPDLDAAADAMRHLYDHPDVARELGRRARASVTATRDAATAAASFGERFAALTGAGADR